MGMTRLRATKVQNFAVTVDRCLLIFTTVMSKVTFHQPCLSMMWVDLQNTVNENLGNFPSFFGNSTSSVRPINTDL